MTEKKTTKKISKKAAIKGPTEGDDEVFEKTVVTAVDKVDMPRDEKAFILFISGPLMGKMYLLERDSTVIGRSDDVDISIPDSRISRHHLRIIQEGGEVVIEDMGSTNGTFVNGERITSTRLRDGDRVTVGRTSVVYRAGKR